MAISKHLIPAAGGRKALAIYAETTNINYFLKTPLTPADAGTATVKQTTVKAHTRRQGPGDVGLINVPATNREVLIDPTRKSGNALPGYSVLLVSDRGMVNQQKRTVTVQGRWVDFHAYMTGNAKMQVQMYSESGARSTIKAATI